MTSLQSKKRGEIEKSVTAFEKEADPKFLTKDDKELIEKLKKLLANKNFKDSMFVKHKTNGFKKIIKHNSTANCSEHIKLNDLTRDELFLKINSIYLQGTVN